MPIGLVFYKGILVQDLSLSNSTKCELSALKNLALISLESYNTTSHLSHLTPPKAS